MHTDTYTSASAGPLHPIRMGWAVQRVAAIVAIASLLAVFFPDLPESRGAHAASSWSPTLLVNTEAFQVIDDSDAAANLALRFGATVNEEIRWDRGAGRFNITDDVYVEGGLETTGGITAGTTFQGAGLADCDNAMVSKLLWSDTGSFSCGTDQSGGGGLPAGSDTQVQFNDGGTAFGGDEQFVWDKNENRLNVRGTMSGEALRISSNADIWGTLSATGVIKSKSDITLNGDNDTNNAVLTFGNQTAAQTLKFLHALQEFEFSKGLRVSGQLSGSGTLSIEGGASVDDRTLVVDAATNRVGVGTKSPRTALEAVGTISGSVLTVSNLRNCDTVDTDGAGNLACGTDSGGGGGTPGGSDKQVQFNDATAFGGDADFTWDKTNNSLDIRGTASGRILKASQTISGSGNLSIRGNATVSGSIMLQEENVPATPPAGYLKVYSKSVAGRVMPYVKDPAANVSAHPLQASFAKNVYVIAPAATTTVTALGTTTTNSATLSHPVPTEALPYMTNFATSTTSGNESGLISVNAIFFRGSTAGFNGFFYFARVAVIDTALVRLFSGLTSATTLANTFGSDNPAGHFAGFQFSTVRADVNWKLFTKDGTTQALGDTGIPVTANNVYDLTIYVDPQGTTLYWRVENRTAGTVATGSTSSNLPGGSTALRIAHGVETQTTVAKSFRMGKIYLETNR